MQRLKPAILLLIGLAGALMLSHRSQADPQPSPSLPGDAKIDFSRQIRPILQSRCGECHLNGKRKGGLRLDSREWVLRGGDSGPAVVAHEADKSLIIARVTSSDPDEAMPKKGPKLSAEQVALLRKWIEAGLPWEGILGTPTKPSFVAPLLPRRPAVPAAVSGSSLTNPIDLLLQTYFSEHHIRLAPPIEDRAYARRVFLDVTGLLPNSAELEAFLKDPAPDKRERLVTALLSENRKYAENWLSFWNDALRNDYQGTGYIDGGRTQITAWLYRALFSNMPYDQFVRELVNPVPGSEGFVNGIIWRGAVSASQRRELQAAQSISQVFMGINMKCNSCHDSFISDWKLADAYGLAGVYADRALEMFRCEKPTGNIAPVKFMYPELGSIDGAATRAQRLQQLAELMTSRQNGRFARTIVNRIWARLLGHGIVEPTDEMDREPWDADLLDWLASNLADNRFDLKKSIGLILTSRAYQMPSVGMHERDTEQFVFEGPVVRRMSAEDFLDSVWQLTDGWPAKAASDAFAAGAAATVLPHARWIWKDPHAATATEGLTIYLRKTFDLPNVPASASAIATCDNRFTLFVNGHRAAAGSEWSQPQVVDLRPFLVSGKNVFAVIATNDIPETPNPAGFWMAATVRLAAGAKPIEIGTGADWQWSLTDPPGWDHADFQSESWKQASDLGDTSIPPWNLARLLGQLVGKNTAPGDHVRAVWVNRDAIMAVLGRPNREQVVTSRTTYATMLQALELTNGAELSRILQGGARHWMDKKLETSGQMIDAIFRESLGRDPTADEQLACRQIIGSPPRQEGVEDLLWSIVMLPEFQLIR